MELCSSSSFPKVWDLRAKTGAEGSELSDEETVWSPIAGIIAFICNDSSFYGEFGGSNSKK